MIPRVIASLILAGFQFVSAKAATVELAPASSPAGYLARLMINETPFPGDPLYESEESTKEGMLSILWVLNNRLHHIPPGYTQEEVAAARTGNIIDLITTRGQVEDFFRASSGEFTAAPRVFERVDYLVRIANEGAPGRFARLLNYAQQLAQSYFRGRVEGADLFVNLRRIGAEEVTGRGFAWMTADLPFEPGGNFITIPKRDEGILGGNRFYTLRQNPQ